MSRVLGSVRVQRASSCATGRRQGRQLAGVEDSYRVGRVGQGYAGLVGAGARDGGRGIDDGHGREVLGVLVVAIVVVAVVERDLRRGFWRPPLRHVDDEGLGHLLAAGEKGVEGAAHLLLGPQSAVLPALGVARDDAQGDVGRVEAAAERICVLFENHLAHVVDQVVLADLHERGRGIGPLDPDLAVQHDGAGVCGWTAAEVVVGGGRRRVGVCGRRWGSVGDVRGTQGSDDAGIRGGGRRAARARRREAAGDARGLGRRVVARVGGSARRRRGLGEAAQGGGLDGGMDGRGLLERQLRAGGRRVLGAGCGRRGRRGAGGRRLRRARVSIARGRVGPAAAPRLGGMLGRQAQHLRPHHARVDALGEHVVARRLGQLGQRDAAAQAAARLQRPALAARRRGQRACRGAVRAAAPHQLVPRIVQPCLDAAHAREEPDAASMQSCRRRRCVGRAAVAVRGVVAAVASCGAGDSCRCEGEDGGHRETQSPGAKERMGSGQISNRRETALVLCVCEQESHVQRPISSSAWAGDDV